MYTCGTCDYWKEVNKYNVGKCIGIQHDELGGEGYDDDCNPIETNNDSAFVVDGSGYFAALKTRENFGCVMHSEYARESDAY